MGCCPSSNKKRYNAFNQKFAMRFEFPSRKEFIAHLNMLKAPKVRLGKSELYKRRLQMKRNKFQA